MLSALILQLSFSYPLSMPEGDTWDTGGEPGVYARAGLEPLYLWGSYGNQSISLLGQSIADSSTAAAGIGFEYRALPQLSLFLETGYAWHSLDARPVIQQEVVYTQLVRRHHVAHRPIPVDVPGPYVQDSYATEFKVDGGPMARFGVTWHMTDNVKLDLAYRHMPIDTYIAMYDPDWRAAGRGWWEERDVIDASAVELRLGWRF